MIYCSQKTLFSLNYCSYFSFPIRLTKDFRNIKSTRKILGCLNLIFGIIFDKVGEFIYGSLYEDSKVVNFIDFYNHDY